MRKVVLLAAALVVALGRSASSATSAASETGVTARTVTIGGTFPLTGPASLYATIPPATAPNIGVSANVTVFPNCRFQPTKPETERRSS